MTHPFETPLTQTQKELITWLVNNKEILMARWDIEPGSAALRDRQ